MNRIWQYCLILLVLVAVAIPLRWVNLSQRPFHADESVQATKFRTFWQTHHYKYDPNEFHGPILNYASVPIQWISGADIDTEDEGVLRSVPAVFSILTLLLLFLFRNALGRTGLTAAGILLCISPSLLFYSRYYIHETLLAFTILLALASAWRYVCTGKLRWCILTGAAVGLMAATKETFVFNIAAASGGIFLLLAIEKFRGPSTLFLKRIPLKHWLLGLIGFLAVSFTFFTSFFTNFAGLLDAFRAYLPWLGRAGGDSPHIWPWYYYLQRYFWFSKDGGPIFTEAIILLPACLGVWAGFKDHFSPLVRRLSLFLTGYTTLLTIIYCITPYKTPWCFIGVIQGLILLAGLGCAYLFSAWRSRIMKALIALILIAGVVHLSAQGYKMNTLYCDMPQNPHVYAHTVSDVRGLIRCVEKLSTIHPDGKKMLIQVITRDGDCWPLPWYLRQFENNTGWYSTVPDELIAPVIIYSPTFGETVKEKTKSPHQIAGFYGFRPRVFLQLSVEKSLWDEYVQKGLARDEDED